MNQAIERQALMDEAAAQVLGVGHAAIARRMRELRDAAVDHLGRAVRMDPHLKVEVDGVRGRLTGPFEHGGFFDKINTTVVNTRTGRRISYSDLSIHLIEAHTFYGLPNSPYRLDPLDLIETLAFA